LTQTSHGLPLTAPATVEAKKWSGWGTALKPAAEHWLLVRKPPSEKTLARNILKHGVGGINIAASKLASGRWPANLTHDGNILDEKYARYFYAAKPGKKERNLGCAQPNRHPTVKSVALMDYLVRLVTPPGGTVLDIFAGSGTTGVAALKNGFTFVGVENDPVTLATARDRLTLAGRATCS
jgi:site-specific DNA-methyltransferase (adenine-specific)